LAHRGTADVINNDEELDQYPSEEEWFDYS
jgi:hypothetical protein